MIQKNSETNEEVKSSDICSLCGTMVKTEDRSVWSDYYGAPIHLVCIEVTYDFKGLN